MYWPEKVYDLLLNENKHYISELIPLINMFICIKSLERYTVDSSVTSGKERYTLSEKIDV